MHGQHAGTHCCRSCAACPCTASRRTIPEPSETHCTASVTMPPRCTNPSLMTMASSTVRPSYAMTPTMAFTPMDWNSLDMLCMAAVEMTARCVYIPSCLPFWNFKTSCWWLEMLCSHSERHADATRVGLPLFAHRRLVRVARTLVAVHVGNAAHEISVQTQHHVAYQPVQNPTCSDG